VVEVLGECKDGVNDGAGVKTGPAGAGGGKTWS
jgi:hypothetical protein